MSFLKRIKIIYEEVRFNMVVIYYKLRSFYSSSNGINLKDQKNNIVVSLTTFPARVKFVHLAIETLLNQYVKPDHIILWLSEDEFDERNLPKSLIRLEARGLTIKFIEGNVKSYKKLIYALKEYEDYNIVTCDDDTIYPRHFIEGLIRSHKKHPECIVAYRCKFMAKENESNLKKYSLWENINMENPHSNLFPTGVGGVLYPPHSFNIEVFNKDNFLELCPLADDVWFKAMALINNTKTVMVNNKTTEFPLIPRSQVFSLWKSNIECEGNDSQLKNVFDHYKLYDRID